jgi:hypothetical protein
VSPRELWLLQRYDNHQLLADLCTLHNVSTTVQQSTLILGGRSDAMDMAAAEIRQTIAIGRANWGVPQQPMLASLYAEKDTGLTWRTLDVSPEIADVLGASHGAQALHNAQDHLARTGICLEFARGGLQNFSLLNVRAAQPIDADDREPATLTLCGGKTADVDYAEHVLRRWLGLDMSSELDILQSLASTLQQFGLANVSPPVWNAPQGDLTAFRSWCSHVLRVAASDSDGAYSDQEDGVSWAFGQPHPLDSDAYLAQALMAEWLILHLLIGLALGLALGYMAFRAIYARCIAPGSAPVQPRVAGSGNANQARATATGKGGAAAPQWMPAPQADSHLPAAL